MGELLILIGVLIFMAGLVTLLSPMSIYGLFQKHADKRAIQFAAVATRLLIGVLLIAASSHSKFPVLVEILGFLSVFAAIVLVVIGGKRFRKLLMWSLNALQRYGRFAALLAMALGGFLVFAFT